MKRLVLAALIAAAVPCLADVPAQWGNLRMGTYITATVWGQDAERAESGIQFVDRESERLEGILSARDPQGGVTRLNTLGGCVKAPAEVLSVVTDAILYARESEGAFDPTIAPVVELWKADRPDHRVPERAEILSALEKVGWNRLQVREGAVCLGDGQSIDLGGIAKGWIATEITDSLRRQGYKHAMLDFGGNVALVGGSPKGRPWRIGIQDPDQARGVWYAVVEASDCSVVTSGGYERNFESGGIRYHHILDPKTGSPSRADLASTTIVDRDGGKADALCTALFVMGWDRAREWLAAHPQVQAVLLRAGTREIYVTEGLKGSILFARDAAGQPAASPAQPKP